jgi:hypothetical protein
MNAPERVALLVGSGKARTGDAVALDGRSVGGEVRSGLAGGSTSEALGSYLLLRLRELGCACDTRRVYGCLTSEEGRRGMLAAVREASLVVLSFPLFWDALPAAMTRALELVAEDRHNHPVTGSQRLVAIVNSGFPEVKQSETAIGICRQFSCEAGFAWAGALALGGGAFIAGRPLEKLGGRVRSVMQALDLTAAALVDGQRVPAPAVGLMARSLVPPLFYRLIGNAGWRRRAKRFGVNERLFARPYER